MRIRILIGLIYWLIICNFAHCRTPCGCVDWNLVAVTSMRALRMESHPVWVRGLKLNPGRIAALSRRRTPCGCVDWNGDFTMEHFTIANDVAPRVGAWIETQKWYLHQQTIESHPVWVRGLKRNDFMNTAANLSRTPCGCVDWNFHELDPWSFGLS